MKHKIIQKKLLRYLDNDLSEREKAKVRSHLENCRSCREALKVVESIWIPEQPIDRKTAPPFLWTGISTRLRSEEEQGVLGEIKKPGQAAFRPLIMVAVLVLIFFSGIKLGNLITGSSRVGTDISTERITDNFGMVYFEILPPGSIDAGVLGLIESETQR